MKEISEIYLLDLLKQYKLNKDSRYSLNEVLYLNMALTAAENNVPLESSHLFIQSLFNKLFHAIAAKGRAISELYKDCLEYYSANIDNGEFETLFKLHNCIYELFVAIESGNKDAVKEKSENCFKSNLMVMKKDPLLFFFCEIEILFPTLNFFIREADENSVMQVVQMLVNRLSWYKDYGESFKTSSVCQKDIDSNAFIQNCIDSILYTPIKNDNKPAIIQRLINLNQVEPLAFGNAVEILKEINSENSEIQEKSVFQFLENLALYPRMLQFVLFEQLKGILYWHGCQGDFNSILHKHYKIIGIALTELNYKYVPIQ